MVLKKFKYKKVSSTNDIAMQKIRQGYKSGVIISDKQTRGRAVSYTHLTLPTTGCV